MFGFLAKVRDAAAAVAPGGLGASGTGGGGSSLVSCRSGGNAALDAALRRVTHSDCAAVPPEHVQEVVCLASESEEALAIVLRHIEEHIFAPGEEWRRIHGTLALLERMVRPPSSSGAKGWEEEDALVGRTWYEVKVQDRISALMCFEYSADPRVVVLMRRAANLVRAAAEQYVLSDTVETERASTTVPGSPLAGASDSAGEGCGEGPVAPLQWPAAAEVAATVIGKSGAQSPLQALPGRQKSPGEGGALEPADAADAAKKLKSTALSLDALRNPATREGAATRSPELGKKPPTSGLRCCCCRRLRGSAAAKEGERSDEEAGLLV